MRSSASTRAWNCCAASPVSAGPVGVLSAWLYIRQIWTSQPAFERPVMDFALTEQQLQIRDEVLKLCAGFDDAYWLERDRTATFPDAFFTAMADGNWLGIAIPERYGGAGLGITEAAILMQAVAESGACMSGASAIHLNIFGLNPVLVFGTET